MNKLLLIILTILVKFKTFKELKVILLELSLRYLKNKNVVLSNLKQKISYENENIGVL